MTAEAPNFAFFRRIVTTLSTRSSFKLYVISLSIIIKCLLFNILGAESKVDLIMADHGTEIGEWVGLAKLNADGQVRKAVRCSVAVVTDFGEDSHALDVVLNYVKSQNGK